MQVDPVRVARALHLEVEGTAPDRWQVTGGEAAHEVARTAAGVFCDCVDARRGQDAPCKHRLAVVLARLPVEVREALRALVPPPVRRRRATRAQASPGQ